MSKTETKNFRLVCAFDKLIEQEEKYLDKCFAFNEIAEEMQFTDEVYGSLISIIKSEHRTERKKLIRLFNSEVYISDKAISEDTIFIVVECSELEVLEHLDLLMFHSDSSLKTLLLSQDAEIDGADDFPMDEYHAAFPDFYAPPELRFGASYLNWVTASKLERMTDEYFATVRRF